MRLFHIWPRLFISRVQGLEIAAKVATNAKNGCRDKRTGELPLTLPSINKRTNSSNHDDLLIYGAVSSVSGWAYFGDNKGLYTGNNGIQPPTKYELLSALKHPRTSLLIEGNRKGKMFKKTMNCKDRQFGREYISIISISMALFKCIRDVWRVKGL